MEGQGSQQQAYQQAYQQMDAGFQHQSFGQAVQQPQFHTGDQNDRGVQHQASENVGPAFNTSYYQQTHPEAQYHNRQDQYRQQPTDRTNVGRQITSFRGLINQYNDFVPGNIAHGSACNPVHHQPPNQETTRPLSHRNGAPEQQRMFPSQEDNSQYQHQNLIQNLHQTFHRAPQQPSYPNGQSNQIRQHENASMSVHEQVKDHQNNLSVFNSANNCEAPVKVNSGMSHSVAEKDISSNGNTHGSLTARAETTPVSYSGVVPFKNPTPNTAPPSMGSETPTPDFNSRRAQTVFRMKTGPLRGPPTLWRNGMAPPAGPLKDPSPVTSAVKSSPQSQVYGSTLGVNGFSGNDDPFTDRGYPSGPKTMQMAIAKTIDVGPPIFATNEPLAGSVVPITIVQQENYGPSAQLALMCPNGAKPSIETALFQTNLPFIEIGRQCGPAFFGVLRIANIPYNTSRAEVIAFLGRNARIVNENIEPVHIIMDRVTGKTEEVFVEFTSLDEVVNAVRRYQTNRRMDRGGLVGDRHVTLEISTQEQLMERLFPKAKNVRWDGAQPIIMPPNQYDIYNSGFKGFVTQEEMVMLVKHAQHPLRTSFSTDCPQRPFECLISTLVKYPWYMTGCITIAARDIIYDGTLAIIKQLIQKLKVNPNHTTIDSRLLRRLYHAALRCPGFSEMQKDNIAFVCDIKDSGLAPYADHWHVFKVLGPRYGVPTDVLLYYMALIREATSSPEHISLAEQASMFNSSSFGKPNVPSVFGNFKVQYPPNFKDMSMAEIGEIEWNAIDRVLRKILGSAQPTRQYMIAE